MQTTHSDTALYALTQEIKFTQHILFIFASDFVRSYAYLYQEDKPCPRGVYTGISPASSDHISACRYSSNLLFSFWNFEFVLKTSGYPTGLETFRCRILLQSSASWRLVYQVTILFTSEFVMFNFNVISLYFFYFIHHYILFFCWIKVSLMNLQVLRSLQD